MLFSSRINFFVSCSIFIFQIILRTTLNRHKIQLLTTASFLKNWNFSSSKRTIIKDITTTSFFNSFLVQDTDNYGYLHYKGVDRLDIYLWICFLISSLKFGLPIYNEKHCHYTLLLPSSINFLEKKNYIFLVNFWLKKIYR